MYIIIVLWYPQFKLRQYFVLFMLFSFFCEVWIIDFHLSIVFARSFIMFSNFDKKLLNFIQKRNVFYQLHNVL